MIPVSDSCHLIYARLKPATWIKMCFMYFLGLKKKKKKLNSNSTRERCMKETTTGEDLVEVTSRGHCCNAGRCVPGRARTSQAELSWAELSSRDFGAGTHSKLWMKDNFHWSFFFFTSPMLSFDLVAGGGWGGGGGGGEGVSLATALCVALGDFSGLQPSCESKIGIKHLTRSVCLESLAAFYHSSRH